MTPYRFIRAKLYIEKNSNMKSKSLTHITKHCGPISDNMWPCKSAYLDT